MEPSNPFKEHKPPLATDAALAEASRCLYCYDAPCTRACPTHIDVPRSSRRSTAATCAARPRRSRRQRARRLVRARLSDRGLVRGRVRACNDLQSKPIQIGQLQRHSTDWAMARGMRPFEPGPRRAGRVAMIGGGPGGAGVRGGTVAARLRAADLRRGRRSRAGSTPTGVAEYKMTPEFALARGRLARRGGRTDRERRAHRRRRVARRSRAAVRRRLRRRRDWASVGKLGIAGEELAGVVDAIDFIERAQAAARDACGSGGAWSVIGGGNTVDRRGDAGARLGAEEVTLVYRRWPEEMPAYPHEVELAREYGCRFVYRRRRGDRRAGQGRGHRAATDAAGRARCVGTAAARAGAGGES